MLCFFFSSRRRHTRCALVTGVRRVLFRSIRSEVAMTGEITLRGRVLPIGGLKEKLLAALRGGITKVLIPEENSKDLADIPKNEIGRASCRERVCQYV